MLRNITLCVSLFAFALSGASASSRPHIEPGPILDVQLDPGVAELLSDGQVLAQISKAVTRFGGKLDRITVEHKAMHVAIYTFHFGRKNPAPIHHGVGFFTVDVSFNPVGQMLVNDVSELTLLR